MKKIFRVILVLFIFLLTGCNKNSSSNLLSNMEKKLNDANSYYVTGKMKIINHEDTYEYSVKAAFQKDDYYRIELTNLQNNHEQVILRNDEGVYVDTL